MMTPTLAVAFVFAVPFAVYAARRWHPRIYLVRDLVREPVEPGGRSRRDCNNVKGTFLPSFVPTNTNPGVHEKPENPENPKPCLSCGLTQPPEAACPRCGFCGMVPAANYPWRRLSRAKPRDSHPPASPHSGKSEAAS